jgi:hypothetical protein
MSRKHNTKHDRSPSRYKQRLRARGLDYTPHMRWSHRGGAMSREAIESALAIERRRALAAERRPIRQPWSDE